LLYILQNQYIKVVTSNNNKKQQIMIKFSCGKQIDNILEKGKANVTFLNHYSFLIYKKNISTFDNFNFVMIDGLILNLFYNIFYSKITKASFDMSSLAPKVFDFASSNKKSIYFVGSKPDQIKSFVNVISNKYPKLSIEGFRDGYFADDLERKDFIAQLAAKKPDIVIVGMGTPVQEAFLNDLNQLGWDGLGITCGGFFHQTAMRGEQYYPSFFVKYELRWLFRIFNEKGVLRRYTLDFLIFIGSFLRYIVSNKPKLK
jgi:exopolysaccharide biosynthesis WecB/TagA/CpsF family protein